METDPVWLDRLPLDVCVRIATSTQTSNHHSAICLGNVSPTQRAALLRASEYKLDLVKIARECFADFGKIEAPDNAESGSGDGRESGSDNESGSSSDNESGSGSDNESGSGADSESGSGSNRDEERTSDLGSGSCSHDKRENGSDGEEDNHADDEGDRCSSDEENRCPHDDGASCSDTKSEDAEADHEPHGGSENEDGSDNVNESGSGDETENSSSTNEGERAPDEASQIRKQLVMAFQGEYAGLLKEDVRELVIQGDSVNFFDEPVIQSCLTSASLLTLCIFDLPAEMHSVQHGSNIRALQLQLDDCDILTLLRSFSDLDLRELRLRTTGEKCLHDYFSDDPEGHSLLAELFPQLETLGLACSVCWGDDKKPAWYLWNIMEKFSNLKEVLLCEDVPDSAIAKLRKIERIALIGGGVRKVVEKVPERIVSISTCRVWTTLFPLRSMPSEHAFETLANCDKLEEFNCVMRPGTEIGLLPIVGRLHSLGIAFAGVEPEEDSRGSDIAPIEPKEGVLLDLVKSAPFLRSLRLVNMRIKRNELREILIASGDRLEDFLEVVFVDKWVDQFRSRGGVYVHDNEDNKIEMEEISKTLRTAALNNPKLKTFKLDIRPGWFNDPDAVASTLPELKASFDILQRHAVKLDVRYLKELLHKFATGHFGMIDIISSFGFVSIPGIGGGYHIGVYAPNGI